MKRKNKLPSILLLVFNVLFFVYTYMIYRIMMKIPLTNPVSLKVSYTLQEPMIQLVIDG